MQRLVAAFSFVSSSCGRLDEGLELRIGWPSHAAVVSSPLEVALSLDVAEGAGADLLRSSPWAEWQVCYEARGIAGTLQCSALDNIGTGELSLGPQAHLLDAWLRWSRLPKTKLSAVSSYFVVEASRTSLSDTADYIAIVTAAVETEAAFATFKRHPAYSILEHLTPACGELYVAAVRQSGCATWLLGEPVASALRQNNYIGAPTLYASAAGPLSPTTLRYAKVACDLASLFPLRQRHVVEIGVGYGGQAQVLVEAMTGVGRITFVDLPAVERLALKYLDRVGLSQRVELQAYHHNASLGEVDLVVSNYAYSELAEFEQERYLRDILRLARRGYLTVNPFAGHCRWPLDHFVGMLAATGKHVVVANEVPLTWRQGPARNAIVLWGTEDDLPRIRAFQDHWATDTVSTFHGPTTPTCQLVAA